MNLLILLVVMLIFGGVGGAIRQSQGGAFWGGFLWGALLGIIGLIVVIATKKKVQVGTA